MEDEVEEGAEAEVEAVEWRRRAEMGARERQTATEWGVPEERGGTEMASYRAMGGALRERGSGLRRRGRPFGGAAEGRRTLGERTVPARWAWTGKWCVYGEECVRAAATVVHRERRATWRVYAPSVCKTTTDAWNCALAHVCHELSKSGEPSRMCCMKVLLRMRASPRRRDYALAHQTSA